MREVSVRFISYVHTPESTIDGLMSALADLIDTGVIQYASCCQDGAEWSINVLVVSMSLYAAIDTARDAVYQASVNAFGVLPECREALHKIEVEDMGDYDFADTSALASWFGVGSC